MTEVGFPVPAVLRGDLGKEEALVSSLGHDDSVPADFDLIDILDWPGKGKNRDLDLQPLELPGGLRWSRGRFEIFVHDLSRGSAVQITSGPGNKENPRWAPDGRHLVFSSSRSGEYRICTVGADGSNLRELTSGAAAFTPDWSHPG